MCVSSLVLNYSAPSESNQRQGGSTSYVEVDQLDGKGHILWDLYFQAVLPTDIGTGTWSLRTQTRANKYGTAPVDKPFQDLPRRLTTRPISNDLC